MDWVPENVVQDMLLEAQMYPERSRTDMAVRVLEDNAPVAARSIVHLALYAENERIRLDAAKFVIEYAAGRATAKPTLMSEDVASPLLELRDAVVVDRRAIDSR